MLRSRIKLLCAFKKVTLNLKFKRLIYLCQKPNCRTIIAESDADTFGRYSPQSFRNRKVSEEIDESDEKDEIVPARMPKNLFMKKIKKAVAVLNYDGAMKIFKEFVASNKPDPYIYRLLFSCGAKLGKAQETFSLYQDLRKRGIANHPSMFTSLLYACVNCENSELALRISKTVGNYIFKENLKSNQTHINVMLLVFARHGDIKSAFNFIDYWQNRKVTINTSIYNYLIENCCSNKEYGLRLAVLIYHCMVYNKQFPDAYTFAVLAKCVKTCSFGGSNCTQDFIKYVFEGYFSKSLNEEFGTNFLSSPSGINKETQTNHYNPAQAEQNRTLTENCSVNGEKEEIGFSGSTIPEKYLKTEEILNSTQLDRTDNKNGITNDFINILKPKPLNGVIVNCDELSKCENRLMMFGGLKGFLEVMSDFGVKPNLRLFSMLLQCLPPTNEAETELFRELKKFNIEPDLYFMNILLNRMIDRKEFETFEDYLDFAEKHIKQPCLRTIGTLARVCDSREKAMKCVEYARSCNLRVSCNILVILLKKAGPSGPGVVSYLREVAEEDQVELSNEFEHLVKIWHPSEGISNSKQKKFRKTKHKIQRLKNFN